MFTNLQYGGTMPFAKTWRCADRVFDLSARPLIMGILNVTPDSFSDGGDHNKHRRCGGMGSANGRSWRRHY